MSTNDSKASNNALAILVGLLAIIAGVYAMVEPMGQRIDFLEQQIIDNRQQCQREMAGLEKDIDSVRAAAPVRRELEDKRDLAVQARDSAQWERIRLLEREVYGKSLEVPNTNAVYNMHTPNVEE